MGTTKFLTESDCVSIIQNRFPNKKVTYVSHEIKPLSENSEGFLGEHFKLKILYSNENESASAENFFCKSAADGSNKMMLTYTVEANVVNKELLVYRDLVPQYENRGYGPHFAPKSYLCKKEFLILEDLSVQGFKPVQKLTTFGLEECKVSLKTLANLHSCAIALQEDKSRELGRPYFLVDDFCEELEEGVIVNNGNMWAKFMIDSAQAIVGLIDRSPLPIDKVKVRQKFWDSFHGAFELIKPKKEFLNIHVHGDLWSNNFLFKYDNNKAIDCRLVDYQFARYSPPSYDVLLLFYMNTDRKFREKYLDSLLKYYHQLLSDELAKKNVNVNKVLPFDKFLESCKYISFVPKFQAMFCHNFAYTPDELINEKFKDEEGYKTFVTERETICVHVYENYELFRKIVDDDIGHLAEMFENDSL